VIGALVGMSAACAAMLVPVAISAPKNRFFMTAPSAIKTAPFNYNLSLLAVTY
jgi:hypothetical protein